MRISYASFVGMGIPLPDKKDVARGLLLRGSVYVHLDPRVCGVEIPSYLSNQPQVVLRIALDMAVPIPDLRVDSEGISGTLSFSRKPFKVIVPWDAIFALKDEQGRRMVWPDSLPPEIQAEVEREMGIREPAAGLRVVEGGAEAVSVDPVPRPRARRRELPPYLRVVK